MEAFLSRFDYFLLFLFRTAAFLVSLPVFGKSIKNKLVKSAFALLLSVLIFPIYFEQGWESPEGLGAYVALIAKESLVGLFLSFVFVLAMSAVRMAGELVGLEMGLRVASQIDPITGTSTPLIAYLYELIAVLVFLSLNLHHWLFQGFFLSYEILPVGVLDLAKFSPEWFMSFFREIFISGLILATPVFVVMAMMSLVMGFLARAVPNFNILTAGYTMRVLLAFGAMFVFMPGFISAVARLLGRVREGMFSMMMSLV